MMKQKKPLTREQYLKKFTRAARWRLPPRESEEAIADYRELVFQPERDESRLVEELGEPVQAARLLTDVKTYRRWLAVFAVLVFGLFLMAKWAWTGHTPLYIHGIEPWWYPVWVMAVGLALSLYWFRRHGQKDDPLPRRLLIALGVVFVAGCVFLGWFWQLSGVDLFEELPGGANAFQRQIYQFVTAMMGTGVFAALAGLAGLVLARCRDRRWLAIYLLCLTLAAMLGVLTFQMGRMDISLFETVGDFRSYLFLRLLPIGAAGLIGTGVALC